MNQNNSQHYLIGLSKGDDAVIQDMYKKFFPKVRNFIIKNKGAVTDAEEVFQDALFQLSVRMKVNTIEIQSSFEGYLFTVCKNLWRKELNAKKKWVRNDDVVTLKDESQSIAETIVAQERWDLFQEKLELLSDNCKQLLKMYFKKTPYDEIVEKFNYSSENVAFQRVFKCKKRLTDLVKSDLKYKKLI